MKKSEVIERIDPKKTYIGSYVISRINDVSAEDTYMPKYLKYGDVVTVSIGAKSRPAVIIKIIENSVIAIPLTTAKNHNFLMESKSRFLKDGYFCNSYTVMSKDDAIEKFIGVFDDDKMLNEAVNQLGIFFMKTFLGLDVKGAEKHNEYKVEKHIEIKTEKIKQKIGAKQKFLYKINGVNYKGSDVFSKFKINQSSLSMAFKNTDKKIIKGYMIEKIKINKKN
tara:strand:- start:77 stop:745 length:669 start_codon:yes stop_codon:yes gene_type:complete